MSQCAGPLTLMKRMGIEALYRKPNASRRYAQHKIWPYLLRGMTINRANQVWALDTSHIPMARGFVYLTAGTPDEAYFATLPAIKLAA
jgi:putative transposase